jgi:thiosulfate reductase cytochrome b subunit
MADLRHGEVSTLVAGDVVRRHGLPTRLWHWTNVLALVVLLMSGLTIFNAHPRLYWGQFGANPDPAWLMIGAERERGYLRIGATQIDTTGVLGRATGVSGNPVNRAFPHWATIPSQYSLADGRRWHLTFAWLLSVSLSLYLLWSLLSRHLWRDLLPRGSELAPRHLWRDILDHARLRFPTGVAALSYNVLQKLSYVGVLCLLLPVMVLTGLTMSPSLNASWPWLLDLFGGRQSARSVHFIAAFMLVAFVVVHLMMVVLAGPLNELRSMITGRYRLPGRARGAA